jgi:hypothetical protein
VALVAAAPGLAVACSGAGGGGHAGGSGERATRATAPPVTAAPATDEASRHDVARLVDEATGLADRFFRDPSVVDDPGNPDLVRYRQLYTDDSPTPDAVEAGLRVMVEQGEHYQPAASGFMREVEIYQWSPPPDEDTLYFDTCSVIDRERVGTDGTVLSTDARLLFVAGEAHRIDGEWRFYGLSNDVARTVALTPGAARPGTCAGFVEAADGGFTSVDPSDPVAPTDAAAVGAGAEVPG